MDMKPIDTESSDLFTVEEFHTYVKAGGFIPYDGDGCWATDREYDLLSNVWKDKQFDIANKPDWATHVAWFNR